MSRMTVSLYNANGDRVLTSDAKECLRWNNTGSVTLPGDHLAARLVMDHGSRVVAGSCGNPFDGNIWCGELIQWNWTTGNSERPSILDMTFNDRPRLGLAHSAVQNS